MKLSIQTVQPGQIWHFEDEIVEDKYNLPEEDRVLRGNRYCLIVECMCGVATIIPMTTNDKYREVSHYINFDGEHDSYFAINMTQTVNIHCLTDFVTALKPYSIRQIMKSYCDYLEHKIYYDSIGHLFRYKTVRTTEHTNDTVVPKEEPITEPTTPSSITETPKEEEKLIVAAHVNENGEVEKEEKKIIKKKRKKRSDSRSPEEIAFIIFSPDDEVAVKFNLNLSTVKNYKSKFRSMYQTKKLNSFNDYERRFISKNSIKEILKYYPFEEEQIEVYKELIRLQNQVLSSDNIATAPTMELAVIS